MTNTDELRGIFDEIGALLTGDPWRAERAPVSLVKVTPVTLRKSAGRAGRDLMRGDLDQLAELFRYAQAVRGDVARLRRVLAL